jgi:hypothetical protein
MLTTEGAIRFTPRRGSHAGGLGKDRQRHARMGGAACAQPQAERNRDADPPCRPHGALTGTAHDEIPRLSMTYILGGAAPGRPELVRRNEHAPLYAGEVWNGSPGEFAAPTRFPAEEIGGRRNNDCAGVMRFTRESSKVG